MPRWILIIFFIIIPGIGGAATVSLEAEKIVYDRDHDLIEASRGVVISYRGNRIEGEHLFYRPSRGQVEADRGFTLWRENQKLSGEKLDYNIPAAAGRAEKVHVDVAGISVSGQRIEVGSEEIALAEATFTTCRQADAHYRLTAQNIRLYPRSGWVVAAWGIFWLGEVPVLPVPTYVYLIESLGEYRQKNTVPLPTLGTNAQDRFFLDEKVGYFVNPASRGEVRIYATERQGTWFGLDHRLNLSPAVEENLRIYYSTLRGGFGGITHRQSFFREGAWEPLVFSADLKLKERINYEWVSFLPYLTLNWQPALGGQSGVAASVGLIEEESTALRTAVYGFTANYRGEVGLEPLGKGGGELAFDGRGYGNGQRWLRLTGSVDIRKSWGAMDSSFAYYHYFVNEGATPFNFERYWFQPEDELRGELSLTPGLGKFTAAAAYYPYRGAYKDIDYGVSAGTDCFEVGLLYRSVRQEFNLSVSLVMR